MLRQYRYKYEVVHTIHSVLNTFMKVSGGARYYLPRKEFWKLGASKNYQSPHLEKYMAYIYHWVCI